MRIYKRILATSLSAVVAVTQVGGIAFAARPACFVFAANGTPNPIFSANAGSLTAAEASTSQVLEVLAERRSEASPCPPGLSRVNGICVAQQVAVATPVATTPPAPVVAASPAPQAPTVQPASAPKAVQTPAAPVSKSGPSVAVTSPPPQTSAPTPAAASAKSIAKTVPVKVTAAKEPVYTAPVAVDVPAPQPEQTTGMWTEAFAERERRPSSRTSTAGIVVGYDREFEWDGTRVRLGGIGSYSNITASSTGSGVSSRDVTLTLDDDKGNPRGLPSITSVLTFGGVSSTASKVRTSGVGGGFTWSIARGSSYWDGVAKVDMFELNGSASSTNSVGNFLQEKNAPNVFIYDGTASLDPMALPGSLNVPGNVFDRKIYQADGTFRGYRDDEDGLKAFDADAKGCIIAGGNADKGNPSKAIDDTIKKLFTPTSTSKSGTASLAVMTLANTFGFTRDLGHGLSLEPSVGFRYSYSHYYNDDASLGLRDGHVLRLEAGGKLVHLRPVGRGAVWSNTLGLYVYSDVLVDGFVVSTDGSSFKGDQGEVRLRGMLQSKLQFTDGLQIYGEVNGRVGHDYQALGGKLGLRIEW